MLRRSLLSTAASVALGIGALVAVPVAADAAPAVVLQGSEDGASCGSGLFGSYVTAGDKLINVSHPDSSGNIQLTCQFEDSGVYPKSAQQLEGFACLVYVRAGQLVLTYDSKAVLSPSGRQTLRCTVKG